MILDMTSYVSITEARAKELYNCIFISHNILISWSLTLQAGLSQPPAFLVCNVQKAGSPLAGVRDYVL